MKLQPGKPSTQLVGLLTTASFACGQTSRGGGGREDHRDAQTDELHRGEQRHRAPVVSRLNGSSYATYHNGALPTGGSYWQSSCVDRRYYSDDGIIKKVVQTNK